MRSRFRPSPQRRRSARRLLRELLRSGHPGRDLGFIRHFRNHRYPRLGKRAHTFKALFEYLESRKQIDAKIVETGGIREPGTWEGDGQSTVLFDEFTQHRQNAVFTSFEFDRDSVELARRICRGNSTIIEGDSVGNLRRQAKRSLQEMDLLYLDSYDVQFRRPHSSAVHHPFELLSVQSSLSGGALVVVDDAPGGRGKSLYVTEYMARIGAKVSLNEYQIGLSAAGTGVSRSQKYFD